ncbi:MAG: hypothetical protein DRH21_05285, partial [Deltaproteobacteria bacterium]
KRDIFDQSYVCRRENDSCFSNNFFIEQILKFATVRGSQLTVDCSIQAKGLDAKLGTQVYIACEKYFPRKFKKLIQRLVFLIKML